MLWTSSRAPCLYSDYTPPKSQGAGPQLRPGPQNPPGANCAVVTARFAGQRPVARRTLRPRGLRNERCSPKTSFGIRDPNPTFITGSLPSLEA